MIQWIRWMVSMVGLPGTCVQLAQASPPLKPASPEQVVGDTYRVEPAYHVECHVPDAEVDRVLQAVAEAVGLDYGKYDRVAFVDAPGLEQFRPLEGSRAGVQASAGREPTTKVRFSVPRDATAGESGGSCAAGSRIPSTDAGWGLRVSRR
jgi:hypothetical protein